MTTSTPNHNHAVYRPGVCVGCAAKAPVLRIPGYGGFHLGCDGHGCCAACNKWLNTLMCDHYTLPVQAPHREW